MCCGRSAGDSVGWSRGRDNAAILLIDEAIVLEITGRLMTLLDRGAAIAGFGHEFGHYLAHGPWTDIGRTGAVAAQCGSVPSLPPTPGACDCSPVASTFTLASLPIALPLERAPGEADFLVLARTLCAGAEAALRLPAGLALDAQMNYATTACCGHGSYALPVAIRMRVLGIRPGKNAKKKFEYLGVSFVALDDAGRVVLWSEDLFAFTDGGPSATEYWSAVDAGRDPPAKARRRAADCGLLSFVSVGDDGARALAPITEAIRAIVARAAPPAS